MKVFLIIFVVTFLFIIINFILGTSEIQSVWQSSSFECNGKISSLVEVGICSKEYGFSVWILLLSIPIIVFIINLFTRQIAHTILRSLGVGVLWVLVTESLIQFLKIPALYSWELSSLNYKAYTVSGGSLFALLLMLLGAILSGILGCIVGKLITRSFQFIFKNH